jgi:hypothetical protein
VNWCPSGEVPALGDSARHPLTVEDRGHLILRPDEAREATPSSLTGSANEMGDNDFVFGCQVAKVSRSKSAQEACALAPSPAF